MIVVAEKINATRSQAKKIVLERDEAALLDLARSQAAAGAGYLDVNVGTGRGSAEDEAEDMRWAVGVIQDQVETPLCIDSPDPGVLRAGLEAREGRPSLVNSTKAEAKYLEAVVPLAAEFQAPLVGLAMDESGIPKTVDQRLDACDRIASAWQAAGGELDDLYLDPLVIPVSTDVTQGKVTLDTVAGIKERFPGAKTVMGLSNVSFGLPARARLNAAFLHMAVYAGLDAVIADPLNTELMGAVKTAEALVGRDRHCRRYAKAFRRARA